MWKKIVIAIVVLAALIFGKSYVYDYKINHNLETITEGKVYKSGVIPPDELPDYIKKYNIKSVVDLRFPGTGDDVNNPEVPAELTQKLSLLLLKNDTVKATIAKYSPDDKFDEKPEYSLLYTELTGVIQLVIENNSVLKSLKA